MRKKDEVNLKIKAKENEGFDVFYGWLKGVCPTVTSITPTKFGSHHDADVAIGTNKYTFELKYMPGKDYHAFKYLILNLGKAIPTSSGQPAADKYWLQYMNQITVVITREQIDAWIRAKGLQAFTVNTQNICEQEPSLGKEEQIQICIPHEYAGEYYYLYDNYNKIK